MDSLKINTGVVRLQILDTDGTERGIFSFNPTDVKSAEKLSNVKVDYLRKQEEFSKKIDECVTENDKYKCLVEIVDYFKNLVDECFGAGSSEILFGDACTLEMFNDFFEGITPYYRKASEERMNKYK